MSERTTSAGSMLGAIDAGETGATPVRPTGSNRIRSLAWTALKVAVTGVVLARVLRRVDVTALGDALRTASPDPIVLSIVVLTLSPLFGGMRWWIILRATGVRLKLPTVAASYWIGNLFSQILPAVASDGVRSWMLVRQGAPLRSVVHSVILERASMLGALLLIVVGSEPLLVQRVGPIASPWLGPIILVLGLVGLMIVLEMDRWTKAFPSLVVPELLSRLSNDSRKVVLSRWMVPLFILSLAANLNFVVAALAIGHSLNLPLSIADYLAFIPWVVVAMILPISVSGWGVREGLLVAFLGTVGVPSQAALAFSLIFGLCNIASSLPALPLWLMNPGIGRPAGDGSK